MRVLIGVTIFAVVAAWSSVETADAELPSSSPIANVAVVGSLPSSATMGPMIRWLLKDDEGGDGPVIRSIKKGTNATFCSASNPPAGVGGFPTECGQVNGVIGANPGYTFTSISQQARLGSGCSTLSWFTNPGVNITCSSYNNDPNQTGLTCSIAIEPLGGHTGMVCTATTGTGGGHPGGTTAFCSVNSGGGICSTWNTAGGAGAAQTCSTSVNATPNMQCSAQGGSAGWCSVDQQSEQNASCTSHGGNGACSTQGGGAPQCSARVNQNGSWVIQGPTGGTCTAP